MRRNIAVAALALGLSLNAAAADNSPMHFLLGTGLTFGGDKLGTTVKYSDGSDVDLNAGGLIAIYGGLDYRFDNKMSVQATIGYHVDDRAAKNGSVRFDRFPVELLGYYGVTDQVRLGIGLRIVNSPKVTGDGIASGTNYEFENTTGVVLEGEYLFSANWGLKLRAVSESYTPKSGGSSVSGNHGGVYANWYF